MNVVFALIADHAEPDATGKLNIKGVFDRIQAFKFPAKHPELCLVMQFEWPSHEFGHKKTLRVPMVGPGGKEIAALEGSMVIGLVDKAKGGPPKVRLNQIVPFKDLVFPQPGDYAFHIIVQGETKTTVPLEVSKLEPPT